MSRRVIDLSMEVSPDMETFPRIARPVIAQVESHRQFAESIGAAAYGVDWLTAHCVIVQGDHVGTHMDALGHMRADGPWAEEIPIEYCFGDGVLLNMRHKKPGEIISTQDVKDALEAISYTLKPRDIVLIWTGAGAYNNEPRYQHDHSGMSREATIWLIDQGIKVMGCDAPTFDPPVWAMFEQRKFWEAHHVMLTHEYYHLENMQNFERIPQPYGFQISVLPIKWRGATGAAVRAAAIVNEED